MEDKPEKKEEIKMEEENNKEILESIFKKPKTPPLLFFPKPVFKNYLEKNKKVTKTPHSIPVDDSSCKITSSPVVIDELEEEKQELKRPIPTKRKSLSYQSDLSSVPKITESNVIKG